ncbi:MAG: HNH endonuclease [Cyclobacteriaceae bacterium]|nr:HNH endonuclease [Cyclobacteriaceae bacterium]
MSEIKLIYSKTDGCCHLCGKKHRLSDYAITWQREHHIPRANGGGDHVRNLFVACIKCNLIKGTLPSKVVRKWMGLNQVPLSRKAKLRIRQEQESNNTGIFLLILFLLMLFGMYQQKLQEQQQNKLT